MESENTQQDESDVVQHCGKIYKMAFIDREIKYKISFFAESSFDIVKDIQNPEDVISISQNTINEVEIAFTSLELKHLAGIGKFPDIHKQDRPQAIYEKMLGMHKSGDILTLQDISESDFFFDDIDRTQNEETVGMTDEEFQKKIEAERLSNRKILKSDFLGRLSALENLSRTIAQSKLAENSNDTKMLELKIYTWDRKASRSERPHNSDIKANFLIEIYDKNNLEKPYTDFFIVMGKDGTYKGMSIFPSDVSYACDNSGRKVPEITTLSFETFIKGKSISITSADDRIIADCIQREADHNERVAKEMLQDPNKEERKKFFSKLGNQRSRLIKKENRLNKENYYKMIETDLLCSEFSEFDLKTLKSGMEQSLNAPNTSEKKKACLEYEIATVEIIIELKSMMNELEQLLNPENFSVDDYWQKLSAISEYLKNQNVGKDLVMKVADLIEQQKENCDVFTAEVIDDAVKEMKQNAEKKLEDRIDFKQSGTVKPGNIKMMQFHNRDADNSVQINITPDGAAAIPMQYYNPFRDALRRLTDGFKEVLHNIKDKINKAIKQAFNKPQNDDTTQFEFSLEPQDYNAPQLESIPEINNDDKQNQSTEKSNDDSISYTDNAMKNVMEKVNIQGNTDYFTELQSFEQNFKQETEQEDHSLLFSSIPEPEITPKSEITIESKISSVQTETGIEIYDKLSFALESLIMTGYFDTIERSFEEVKQDILLENPDIEIEEADLKFLLDSYDIQLFQEEPDQNQPNKKQVEYNC